VDASRAFFLTTPSMVNIQTSEMQTVLMSWKILTFKKGMAFLLTKCVECTATTCQHQEIYIDFSVWQR